MCLSLCSFYFSPSLSLYLPPSLSFHYLSQFDGSRAMQTVQQRWIRNHVCGYSFLKNWFVQNQSVRACFFLVIIISCFY